MTTAIGAKMADEMQRIVALQLWELGAIKVSLDSPFQLTSGNFSPLYVNCRALISSPVFVDLYCAAVRALCDTRRIAFDVTAGGETAGIPFAAFIASRFGRPMVYVRKDIKSHGLASRIEGQPVSGLRVMLVEDLITDAGSKLSFIQAIRAESGQIEDVLVIFDRLQGGGETLEKLGVSLHALTDLTTALQVGEESGVVTKQEVAVVRKYISSPKLWHQEKGLSFKEVS